MRIALLVAFTLACCYVLGRATSGTPPTQGVGGSSGPKVGRGAKPLAASTGDFARRVLSPTIGLADLPSPERLDVVLRRLRPGPGAALGTYLHAAHLYGDELTVDFGPVGPARVLDLALDSELASRAGQRFGDGQVFARTRHGLRFSLVDAWHLGVDQANTESHPGQGLAALAFAGVPLDTKITAPGGVGGRVGDVLADIVANFSLEGEVFWEAAALAIYLPPCRSWVDKFGREFTFDDLVAELLSRPLDGSSCAGTHILISLTTILRADAQVPLLSEKSRSALRAYLRGVVERLVRSRLEGGGWASDWSEPGGSQTTPRDVIIATGHHLEWMMLLPDDLRPESSTFLRAAEHCLGLLLSKSQDPDWVRAQYCPAIHAARSVWLLTRPESRTRFDPRRGSEP